MMLLVSHCNTKQRWFTGNLWLGCVAVRSNGSQSADCLRPRDANGVPPRHPPLQRFVQKNYEHIGPHPTRKTFLQPERRQIHTGAQVSSLDTAFKTSPVDYEYFVTIFPN